MSLIANVEQLNEEFAISDSRMPFIVFKLLRRYSDREPISLEGPALRKLLEHEAPKMRVNSEEAAVVSSELERFFEHNGTDWVPRPTLFGTT